jgi:hypothetical protein
MTMPAYTADCSLYKSTRGYLAAPNRSAVRGGAVVLVQRLMGAPSTVFEPPPTPGVVYLMKQVCWGATTSTNTFGRFTFENECKWCQWFTEMRICDAPPFGCRTTYVPVGSPSPECTSRLAQID